MQNQEGGLPQGEARLFNQGKSKETKSKLQILAKGLMLVFRGLFQTKNKTKNNIVMHTEDLDMQNILSILLLLWMVTVAGLRLRARCAPLAIRPEQNTENYCQSS